ncbi:Phasin (PHA-granule associated protein) [Limnohabitans sp. JirII-29]|uniref:phasin family protein n=1 Tax=Limnohabitans sp. JirII-29 TaxID=1835756 RepID=UPI000D3BB51C|nr:phasin family protein [Limnohabitans sp. JirII-29]PUE28489.1 Phasin (PHA-granule associated protein) [Limnohabitans sp. JirII-29]
MLNAEQVIATNKANLNNLFSLTNQAFAGVEKLVELNLTAARAAMSESADHAKAVLSVKDAQELLALQAGLIQPLAEKSAAYSRHIYDIASSTSADLSKAIEAKATESQQAVLGYIDAALKNAPAGSESAVAFFKQAVTASNNAVESVQKAVKQATDLAETNLQAVTDTAVKATKTATKKR